EQVALDVDRALHVCLAERERRRIAHQGHERLGRVNDDGECRCARAERDDRAVPQTECEIARDGAEHLAQHAHSSISETRETRHRRWPPHESKISPWAWTRAQGCLL